MSASVDSIFFQARELEDPVARAALLDEVCKDRPEIRSLVEAMLADEEGAKVWFGDTVPDEDPLRTELDTIPGSRLQPGIATEAEGDLINHYRLLQRIGEGGFGTVWLAEQIAPISRKVALKVIKMGMDTREVIARFEAERQALAMMDHPNIATVFDAGATDRGRPYFVMELVAGVPITRYCDEAELGLRERLELFGDVCGAINHAHQKGVIHRDIKPSNVLVTVQDDKPVVKVIDFGIAKAMEEKLTEMTLQTGRDQFIGTPVYMSPEQAALGGIDIDTRSDIYSLGLLLYELLTGAPAFEARTLMSRGYDEMRRIIREVEPPKPSSRISTLGEKQDHEPGTWHGIEPGKLSRLVAGDLDWIVMKAIEKDRSRRYETANALAADLGRYLANEPVEAAAPSTSYRFRKFARRNKVALGIGSLFLAVLIGATGVSTWQAIRATRAEGRASDLLAESILRQQELDRTVSLLTESTDELTSHMRRFVIGTWDFRFELDEERGEREMGESEWAFLKNTFSSLSADFSSQLEFKEDGTSIGSTTPPALFKGLFPHEKMEGLKQGQWELVSQRGKRTTIRVRERGLGGIRSNTEYVLTVLDPDTLQMEDTRVKDRPFKPFIFKRVQ